MRLTGRISRLERARPGLTEAEKRDAVVRELKKDPPAWEAHLVIGRVFYGLDRGPDMLQRTLAIIEADAEMAAALKVYTAGFVAARERAGLEGWSPQI